MPAVSISRLQCVVVGPSNGRLRFGHERCCSNRSSNRSTSGGSSLAPDGYSASGILAAIVEGTGNKCEISSSNSLVMDHYIRMGARRQAGQRHRASNPA
jgi:hypothetical protein